jgi:hypothetical protein
MVAIATQFHGSGFHLTVRTAEFAKLAAFFDLALAGRMRAFLSHRDLLCKTLLPSEIDRQAEP